MGNFDRKNYIVTIWSTVDMTDSKVKEFAKNWNFTCEEQDNFLYGDTVFYHPFAEKILRFIIEYKDGRLIPDKWDGAEPLKRKFDPNDITEIISDLAKGGMGLGLYFRKKGEFWINIANCDYMWHASFLPQGRNKPWIMEKPTPAHRKYFTKIKFTFSEQSHPDLVFLKQLMEDFCEYLETDYGLVYYEENHEILHSYKGTVFIHE